MKNQVNKKTGLFVLLLAILCLCAAALGVTAFTQKSVAYAEDVTLTDAPLTYSFTAASEPDAAYYTVTGVDVAKIAGLTSTQKANLKVTIPAMHDDTTNGEAPVKVIGKNAFNELRKDIEYGGLDFVELDLHDAANLETIETDAFRKFTSEQQLTLPKNVKNIKDAAFALSEFSGIVFNDNLEKVGYSFADMSNWSSPVKIPAKMQITDYFHGRLFEGNIFYGTLIKEITVDPDNEHYKAEDGILFSKNGDVLIAYPGGKESVDVYRVPKNVTKLANRCFQSIENIKTVILSPNVERIGDYAFTYSSGNVHVNGDFAETSWSTYCFAQIKGYVVCETANDKEEFLTKPAFSEFSDKLLYINNISVSFDAGKDAVYIDASAEQLKKYITVTGETTVTGEMQRGLTIPLYDFTLTLPVGGLAVGKNTVTVSRGDFSELVEITVEKTTPAAPAAPIVSETPTTSSITLTAIEGAEYSIDGVTWQDSPTFEGLTANTEYTFYARLKATDTANASAASVVLTVKTAGNGLSGGAIAGIVIGSVLLAGILALLAMFIFRKDKTQGFKAYYIALGRTCAAAVEGLFSKDKAKDNAVTLPKESSTDQDATEEPNDDITEEPNEDTTEKPNDDAEYKQ